MNEWSYNSTLPICLDGMDRGNFTLFLPLASQSRFQIPNAIVAGMAIMLMTVFMALFSHDHSTTDCKLSLRHTQTLGQTFPAP
jgi:hypothetical protein